MLVFWIYVACTFDAPLPTPLPTYENYGGIEGNTVVLGPSNYYGLASIGTMPISLMASVIYSEVLVLLLCMPIDALAAPFGERQQVILDLRQRTRGAQQGLGRISGWVVLCMNSAVQ
jgi:hypothetical protein